MKKLIAMIGAVATAFGLYAADFVKLPYTTPVDVADGTDTIVGYADDATTPWSSSTTVNWWMNGWNETSEQPAKVTTIDVEGKVLDVETDAAPMIRTFNPVEEEGEQKVYAAQAIEDHGLFVDTRVKLVGGEEAPQTGDSKLIVWLKAIDADGDEPGVTNLMVTCGAVEAGEIAGSTNLALVADVENNSWHQITIRANAGTKYATFNVYLDGVQLATADGDMDFPSLAGGNNTLTYVGYQGAGQLKSVDLMGQADAPAFAADPTTVTFTYDANVASIKVDDEEILVAGQTSVVFPVEKFGDDFTAVVTYANGYCQKSLTWTGIEADEDPTDTLTFSVARYAAGSITVESKLDRTEAEIIINGEKATCTYLTDAFAAAKAAGSKAVVSIKLLDNAQSDNFGFDSKLNVKSMEIDLNGHSITGTVAQGFVFSNIGDLTIKDTSDTGAGQIVAVNGYAIYNAGALTINAATGANEIEFIGQIWNDTETPEEEGEVVIDGGKFTDKTTLDGEFVTLPEGKVWSETTDADGFYTLVEEGAKPFAVIIAGVTNEYETLQAAFDVAGAAESAATIKLTANAADNGTLTMGAKNVILDLNDFTLTGDITASSTDNANLQFTVKNGTVNGDIAISNAKLTVYADAVVNGGITTAGSPETKIAGTVVNDDGAAVTVNSGTLVIANTAVLTAETAIDAKAGTVKVLSNSSTSAAEIGGEIVAEEGVTTTINGGVYATDISDKLPADRMTVENEGKYTIVPVKAVIGTTKYPTLAAAVAAADDTNFTIKMIGDSMDEVAIDKTEINGKKIVLTADAPVTVMGQLRAVGGADLTIEQNITLTSTKNPTLFVIGDVSISPAVAGTEKTKVLVNGTVKNENAKFDEAFAISGNGNDTVGADVTIGATGKVEDPQCVAIYWPNPGTLTVNGEVSGYSAIIIKDGALVVNDGAYIQATGDEYHALPVNNNGATPSGDAVVAGYYELGKYGYGTPTITVNGGMFKCVAEGATTIQGYDSAEAAAPADAKSNIAVSGGNFFGGLLVADYLAEGFTLGDINPSTGYASVAQSFAIEVVNAGNKGTLAIDGGATTVIAGNKISGTLTGVESGFTAFVFVDGQKVAIDSETGAFEGVATNSGKVLAAYAKDTAWFVDPFCKNQLDIGDGYSPIGNATDGISYFIGNDPGAGSILNQINIASAIESFGGEMEFSAKKGLSGVSTRNLAVSKEFGVVVTCGFENKPLTAYKYTNAGFDEAAAYTIPWPTEGALIPLAFNNDSTYLYGAVGNVVMKFEVQSDNGIITGFTKVGDGWDLGEALTEAVVYGNLVYISNDEGGKVFVIDTTDGSVTTNIVSGNRFWSMQITGIADGVPHLQTIGKGVNARIYAMSSDLKTIYPTPIFDVPVVNLVSSFSGNYGSACAIDDESKIIIAGNQMNVGVVEHKPANLIVRTIVDNGTSVTTNDEQVAFGAAASVPVTVPAGYDLTAVTVNGAAQEVVGNAFTFTSEKLEEYVLIRATEALQTFTVTFMNGDVEFAKSNNVAYGTTVAAPTEKPTSDEGTFKAWMLNEVEYDFTTPVTTDLTLTAAFEAAGIEPGEEKTVEGDTPEQALENAKNIPIVLTEEEEKAGMTTTYLFNNVKSNGQGGFVAFVDVNKAAIEAMTGPIGIDSTAEEPLKVDADNVTAKVKTVPGVWYGMDEAAELSATEFDPVVSTYTIGDGTTKTFTIPKKANATKAFYKVGVRVIKPTAE